MRNHVRTEDNTCHGRQESQQGCGHCAPAQVCLTWPHSTPNYVEGRTSLLHSSPFNIRTFSDS